MTELVFKGKEFVYNHHLAVPFRPLAPHADKGIGQVALDGNLFIQGDNLHALKALLPIYAGKVDCIFIDPPYNPGHRLAFQSQWSSNSQRSASWEPRRGSELARRRVARSVEAWHPRVLLTSKWSG